MKNAALTCTDTPTSSSVNKKLCLDLGITAWIAWLVAPAVDLSVIGLLTGMRFLSLHGYTDDQLARPGTCCGSAAC